MTVLTPFRLKILKKLTDCIQSVIPTNGYNHDLSDAVFRGRATYGDNEALPMVSILEPPLAIDQIRTQADNTGRDGEWDILIQGWVEDDKANPTDPAYILVADVISALVKEKKAIRKGTRTSDIFGMGAGLDGGNGIENMSIGAPVVRPADEVSARACFYLIITFKIAEDMENPFG